MTFAPRLDVLPPAQRALWPELASLPPGFVLYGGTGLALRLGHRESVDFDFFAHDDLPSDLERRASFLRGAETLQEGVNTRTVLVHRGDRDVKVSLFGGITFGRIGEPDVTEDGVVRVASIVDLAATKVKALLQRVEAKDYRDVDAVLQTGVALEDILGGARALFGASFNPIVARKALCYFEGGDLDSLDDGIKARLVTAATRDHEATLVTLRSARLE